jgi:hypothetical protein
MNNKIIFEEVVEAENIEVVGYSKDCTNAAASACCTKVCSQLRKCISVEDTQWEEYVAENAGVVQY